MIIKEPICVYIDKKHNKKIMDFAEAVSKTTNYSDCNQNNHKLKVYQHYIGKLGELAVYLYLRDKTKINPPDFNIYNSKNKSWDSDLRIDDTPTSIKCQDLSSAKRFGLSWTFQHISNGRKDSSIEKNDLVIPTIFDNYYNDELRVVILPSIYMKEIIFGEPKKDSLKGKKKVMYAIDNYKDLNQWLVDLKIPLN